MSQFRPVNGVYDDGTQRADNGLAPTEAFRPATMSTTPYKPPVDPRRGLCVGNDNTCGARQAKGTALCAGHLRSMAKAQKEAREAEVTTDESE